MKSLAEGSATARQDNELKQRLANAASETEPLTGALHILMFVFEFACTARRPNVCFCVCVHGPAPLLSGRIRFRRVCV